MRTILIMGLGLIIATSIMGCNPASEESPFADTLNSLVIPNDLTAGEDLYNDHCSECHGVRGVGSDEGNPLVHIIYETGHHGDDSFQVAVAQGTKQHHWEFGDMEPVPGVSPSQVTEITAYIRYLQRQVGIN